MSSEKKLWLLIMSVGLVLVLVSAMPLVMSGSCADSALASPQTSEFYLSDIITPLETTINLEGMMGLNEWYTSDVTVTFSVLSTVPDFTTAYSFDGKNWNTYTGSFVISTEGSTTIYYNSTDSDGLVEGTKTWTIQIDKTAPDLSLETEIIPDTGVLVTIIVKEDVSYITDIGYRLNEEDRWLRYPGPFLLTNEGLQPIYYRAQDAAGNLVSKLEYVEVVIVPAMTATEVTYTGDLSGVYSDPVNLEAILIDTLTGLPIPSKLIVFAIGTQTTSALTDSEGFAYSTLVLDQPAGLYTVSASFDGDDYYLASSDSSEFQIFKEDAFVFYTGLTIIEESDTTLTLMSTVIEDDDGYWGDLTKIYVTFTIYSFSDETTPLYIIDSIAVLATEFADIGIAIVEIPNLAEGDYLIVVSLDPEQNHFYWSPDSYPALVTIYQPGCEFASGAGWIEDADGNKGHFVFMVKYSCKSGLKGFIFYTLRVGDVVYFVKSTEITGFAVSDDHAFFEASITIYMYNIETDEKVELEDGFRLRIDVWEVKRRHGDDIFQIQIFDKYGLMVYEAGFDPLGYVHRGNIVIHDYCRHRHHRHHWYHKHYWRHRCHCHKHW